VTNSPTINLLMKNAVMNSATSLPATSLATNEPSNESTNKPGKQ
jgi:hypothetical protein